jgi:hypothetical protein
MLSMADIPRRWTLDLSSPEMTLLANGDDHGEVIAFARVCLERTTAS